MRTADHNSRRADAQTVSSKYRRSWTWTMAVLAALAAAPAFAGPDQAKQIVSANCAACHGADGNSHQPTFPKLAGLQAEYLAKQLEEYGDGKRKSDIMGPIARKLKPEEIRVLAAYFSAQTPAPGSVEDNPLAEHGKKIYLQGYSDAGGASCSSCHKPDGSGTDRFPRLAEQNRAYVLQQMKEFKRGARTNDHGRVMQMIAGRMTEQEMKAVAEYIAGLSSAQARR